MRATLSLPLLGATILTLGALAIRLTRGESLRPRLQECPLIPSSHARTPRSLPERLRELGL